MSLTFGERLREVRKHFKLTQAEFANIFGLSSSYMSNMETGKENPSEMFILFLATKFNIDENWLRSGEGSMSGNWDFTDEGMINKYNGMKLLFESAFKKYTGDSLEAYLDAYYAFVSLLSASHLKDPEIVAEYLKVANAIIDNIEKFIVNTDDLRLFKSKKQNYEMLLYYKVRSDELLELITNSLKDAANIYLRHHKIKLEL